MYKALKLLLIFSLISSCSKEVILPQYSLSVSSNPTNGGTVSPSSGTYEEGKLVSITATPSSEYLFLNWSGSVTSTNNPLGLTIDTDKSLTANFEKRTYPLNLTIEGNGVVNEEIVNVANNSVYPSGTNVKLTARPNEGWEFAEWKGDFVGTDTSFVIAVNNSKSITAVFNEISNVNMKVNNIEINSNISSQNIQSTFYNVSGPFHYESDGEHYMFYPGTVRYINGSDISTFKINNPAISSQILKRVNGKWEHFKEDESIKFWSARNFEIVDKFIAIGDGNEFGNGAENWKGDTFFGEIQSQGNIKWTKVNDENNQGYFHGTALGDLNNDGLMDTGGTPGLQVSGSSGGLKIFLQNLNGGFELNNSILDSNYKQIGIPFTFNFTNIVGDDKAEIIMADYGGGDPNTNKDLNQIIIYKFDESENYFKLHWKSNSSTAFYNRGMGATSIKVFDLDNDGIKDISVAREDGDANYQYHSFEVWKGIGDGTFKPQFSSPVWNSNEMQFREFWVLDVNNDGFLDIILRPFHYGSLYRVNPVWWNVPANNGILFNNLIWINQGDGTFESYSKEDLRIEGINIDNVHPYMDGKDLHFMGTFTENDNVKKLTTYDFKITIK